MAETEIRSLLDDKSSYIKASVDRGRIKTDEFTRKGRILQRSRQYGILETYKRKKKYMLHTKGWKNMVLHLGNSHRLGGSDELEKVKGENSVSQKMFRAI